MQCDEVRESAEAYAIGALDLEEREDIERHVETCAECRDLLERATLGAASLALAAPLRPAPLALFARLRLQVDREEESPRPVAPLKRLFTGPPERRRAGGFFPLRAGGHIFSRHWRWTQPLVASLAVLLLGGCAVWIAGLQMQVSRLQTRSQALQRGVAEFEGQRSALQLLASEGTVRFEMQAADPSTGVAGAVIWNPDRHKCSILVSGLPAPSADQTYHVWLVGNQRSWDSGELSTSGSGTAEKTMDLHYMSSQAGYQVVVSLQPRRSAAGGSWQPVLKAWVGIQ